MENESLFMNHSVLTFVEKMLPLKSKLDDLSYIQPNVNYLQQIIEDALNEPIIGIISQYSLPGEIVTNLIIGNKIYTNESPSFITNYIKYGQDKKILAVFRNGHKVQLDATHFSTLNDPTNKSANLVQKHLEYVELHLPKDILANVIIVNHTLRLHSREDTHHIPGHLKQRMDHVLFIVRAGEMLTEAEKKMVARLLAAYIEVTIIANFNGKINESLMAWKKKLLNDVSGVKDVLFLSLNQIANAIQVDSQNLIDANNAIFLRHLEALGELQHLKQNRLYKRLLHWLEQLYFDLERLNKRDPYRTAYLKMEELSISNATPEIWSEEAQSRMNAYALKIVEIEGQVAKVETLFQLLQFIQQHDMLKNEVTLQFLEQANQYLEKIRAFRKEHSSMRQTFTQLELLHKKLYNVELANGQFKRNKSAEQLEAMVIQVNKSIAQLQNMEQSIQLAKEALTVNFTEVELIVNEGLSKYIEEIHRDMDTLLQKEQLIFSHLTAYYNKLQEFNAIEEAQCYMREQLIPFFEQFNQSLSMTDKGAFNRVFNRVLKIPFEHSALLEQAQMSLQNFQQITIRSTSTELPKLLENFMDDALISMLPAIPEPLAISYI